MHALAGQRVQIGRKGRHKGLALAGAHLGDIALMQENPALQLHIKGPQTQGPARRLAAIGKGLGQNRLQCLTAGLNPLLEFRRFCDDPGIAQCRELRLQRVDLRHQRTDRFHLAVVGRAEDFPRDGSKTQHIFSAWPILTC